MSRIFLFCYADVRQKDSIWSVLSIQSILEVFVFEMSHSTLFGKVLYLVLFDAEKSGVAKESVHSGLKWEYLFFPHLSC